MEEGARLIPSVHFSQRFQKGQEALPLQQKRVADVRRLWWKRHCRSVEANHQAVDQVQCVKRLQLAIAPDCRSGFPDVGARI